MRTAALLVLATVSPIGAQEGERDRAPPLLTLQAAMERAVEFSPEYRRAVGELELLSHPRQRWWADFIPRLNLTYGTGYDVDRRTSWLGLDGNPIQNPDPTTVRRSSSLHNLGVEVSLLDGGTRFRQLGERRAQWHQREASASGLLNQTLAGVQRRYLAAQKAQAQLALEEELLRGAEEDIRSKRSRYELLAIRRSELLSAELDLENQRVAVGRARGELEKALLSLRTAIGDPGLESFAIEATAPAPFDPAGLDVLALLAAAQRESPSVASAEAEIEVRRAALRTASGWRWPTVRLSATMGSSTNAPGGTELFGFETNTDRFAYGYQLGVNLAVPVFDGFQRSYATATAASALSASEASLRHARLGVEESIRARYLDLATAWASVTQQAKATDVASQRRAIANEEYLLATIGIEELRSATRDEERARRDSLLRRFEFAEALLALYEEAGIVAREAGIGTSPGSG